MRWGVRKERDTPASTRRFQSASSNTGKDRGVQWQTIAKNQRTLKVNSGQALKDIIRKTGGDPTIRKEFAENRIQKTVGLAKQNKPIASKFPNLSSKSSDLWSVKTVTSMGGQIQYVANVGGKEQTFEEDEYKELLMAIFHMSEKEAEEIIQKADASFLSKLDAKIENKKTAKEAASMRRPLQTPKKAEGWLGKKKLKEIKRKSDFELGKQKVKAFMDDLGEKASSILKQTGEGVGKAVETGYQKVMNVVFGERVYTSEIELSTGFGAAGYSGKPKHITEKTYKVGRNGEKMTEAQLEEYKKKHRIRTWG